MEPTLAYWKIRGLAQPLRLMFAFADTSFNNKLYECGAGPEFNKDTWLNEKFKLGLDFPNLPYYIDGDVKLTQSVAIMEYLSEKFSLNGKTTEERNRCNMSLFEIVDLNGALTGMAYNPKFNDLKGDFFILAKLKLSMLEKFLGTNKFFAGENVTKADFVAFEVFDKLLILNSELFSKTPQLVEFHARFKDIPSIKKYLANNEKLPMNNKMASYGNTV